MRHRDFVVMLRMALMVIPRYTACVSVLYLSQAWFSAGERR